MELHLKRTYKGEKYTIGHLYINDAYFCDVIEDKDRGLYDYMNVGEIANIKVKHETAIPYGTYKVTLSMSNKFGKILPEIHNVKGFSGVRIHSGNTEKDSSGCLIVGENKVKGKVINSRRTMNKLMAFLEPAVERNEEINITID